MTSIGAIQVEDGVALYAAVNSRTNILYLSYPFSNFILENDISSKTIRQKINANCPENIAINPGTNRVYVCSEDGIYDIDGSTGEFVILKKGSSFRSGGGIDVNPVTNNLCTTCFDSDVLTIIDTRSGLLTDKVPVGKNPQGVCVDTSHNQIYVANYDSETISVIDADQSNKLADTIRMRTASSYRLATKPIFLQINEKSKLLYVEATSIYGAEGQAVELDSLFVIDINTKQKIKERQLSTISKQGFAFNHHNESIYTCKQFYTSVLRYDKFAKRLLDRITVEPRSIWKAIISGRFFTEAMAINPVTNKIYVSNSSKHILYEIEA
jgi:DNA-binding beta-propeller fold protein YncE